MAVDRESCPDPKMVEVLTRFGSRSNCPVGTIDPAVSTPIPRNREPLDEINPSLERRILLTRLDELAIEANRFKTTRRVNTAAVNTEPVIKRPSDFRFSPVGRTEDAMSSLAILTRFPEDGIPPVSRIALPKRAGPVSLRITSEGAAGPPGID
jgi:hypothetical protein